MVPRSAVIGSHRASGAAFELKLLAKRFFYEQLYWPEAGDTRKNEPSASDEARLTESNAVENKLRLFADGTIGFDVPEPSPEEIARRKWTSTKCGHIKRDLLRKTRLTGKTLEFALTVVGEDSEIGEKLKAGRAEDSMDRMRKCGGSD